MKKIKGTKRLMPKSKSPGSTPKSTHPGKNLGDYLHPAKLPKGTAIGKRLRIKSISK